MGMDYQLHVIAAIALREFSSEAKRKEFPVPRYNQSTGERLADRIQSKWLFTLTNGVELETDDYPHGSPLKAYLASKNTKLQIFGRPAPGDCLIGIEIAESDYVCGGNEIWVEAPENVTTKSAVRQVIEALSDLNLPNYNDLVFQGKVKIYSFLRVSC